MKIEIFTFFKGGTRTDLALQKADEVFSFEEQRSQVAILVTDGPTNRLEINKNHFVEGNNDGLSKSNERFIRRQTYHQMLQPF